jgi:hypothetical protein
MEPLLAQALQAIVDNQAATVQQQQQMQARMDQMQNDSHALLQQLTQRLAGVGGGPPPNVQPIVAEMEAGVSFSGEPTESVMEWLNKIEARAVAKNWPDEAKKRAAQSTLVGRARTWDLAAGQALDFPAWRAALISNFGRQLTEQQWRAKMELRSQLVGEPAINYCMDKLATIREKPGVLLTPTETVTQLIMGLNDPSQKAILYLHHQQVQMANPQPIDILNDFLTELRTLETNMRPLALSPPSVYSPHAAPTHVSAAPVAVPPPYVAPPVYAAPYAQPATVLDPTVNQTLETLSRQLALLTQAVVRRDAPATTPVTNPVQPATSATTTTLPGTSRTIMKCYNCNLEGHIARNCPMPDRRPSRAANQGNETAGLQGQGRQ